MLSEADLFETILKIDAWLESMRQPGGYGGPVVHWWEDCLAYTGPGLDWRYEGIIHGYLNLWQATGEGLWLDKATRAGDDLVNGQLPSGNYRNSCFELNPNTGGTPHEAAADLGLLCLAAVLKEGGTPPGPAITRPPTPTCSAFIWGSCGTRPHSASTMGPACRLLCPTRPPHWCRRCSLMPTYRAIKPFREVHPPNTGGHPDLPGPGGEPGRRDLPEQPAWSAYRKSIPLLHRPLHPGPGAGFSTAGVKTNTWMLHWRLDASYQHRYPGWELPPGALP
jgi:hypothetical protein